MRSKYFRFVLGLTIGGLLLFLSIKDLSWAEVRAELDSIAYQWIALAVCLYWVELGLRIGRWHVLLSKLKPPVGRSQVAIAFISGYAANNVLPAKLGEAFRADLLGRLAHVSRLSTFGSIIVERLFDLLVVLAMTVWGVLFVTTTQMAMLDEVNRGVLVLLAPIAVVLCGIAFLVAGKDNFLVVRLKALSVRIQNLIRGLDALQDSSTYVKLLASTLLIWGLNSFAMWAIMMSLGVELNVHQTIMLIGLTGISAAIPAAPAGIGTLQYAFHVASILFGFSASAALVASSIVQIVLLGSATLVGAIAYSYAVSRHLLREPEPAQ